MIKIFIDDGHGGVDPGASGNGLREKDLTLDISKRIKKYLDNNYSGHTTRLSRTTDTTLTLSQRTNAANSWGADYLLSVHINSGGGTGYEDYIYNGNVSQKTFDIRNTIHAEIINQIGNVTNRGKKRANFHMLRESRMPAMLSETLFIDTKTDANKLKDSNFLDKVAKGHAVGLAKAFNLKAKGSTSTSKPAAKPSKTQVKPNKSKPKANLIVDGYMGKLTISALQRYFGTPVDSVLSKPSLVIKALQKLLGVKQDGYMGPITIRALQRRFGTPQDGKLSRPSLVIKELQRRLNKGKL